MLDGILGHGLQPVRFSFPARTIQFAQAEGCATRARLAYLREFFSDAQGRIWYSAPPNNKVGYFYLAGKKDAAVSIGK
jgi:hypothetical protein